MLFAPLNMCLLQMLRLEGAEGNDKGQILRLVRGWAGAGWQAQEIDEGTLQEGWCQILKLSPTPSSGASVMDSLGVPIGSIQRILGHQQRRTTENYLQSIGDSERHAMAVFEEASTNSHMDFHTAAVSK